MIGYTWAQLYVNGKMVGPSYGSGLPGPLVPAMKDRAGDYYVIRVGAENDIRGEVLAEARRVDGVWQSRQRDYEGKLSKWTLERTKTNGGVPPPIQVEGGKSCGQ